MQWNDDFKLGIAPIDTQHKELVRLLNQLQTAIHKGDSQKAYANTIRALVEYTKQHFSDEESYMQSINYPNFIGHKKIHESLVTDIKNILINLKQNNPIQPISLMRFLNDWVCKHIMDEDMKIGKFVKNQYQYFGNSVSNSNPLGDAGAEILAKFQSLAKQLEQKALTKEYYLKKCCDILNDDLQFVNFNKIKGLEKAMSFLNYIFSIKHITENDKTVFNKLLIKRALSSNVLSDFSDLESKIRFLKELHNENFLTIEEFDILKKEALNSGS